MGMLLLVGFTPTRRAYGTAFHDATGSSNEAGNVWVRARFDTRSEPRAADRRLEAFGVERACIFADKASGKDFQRPAYQRLVRRLHTGDTVVIKSIDRLGRNYDEILEEWRRLTKNSRAHLVVLDMPLLDTRREANGVTGEFIADMVLQLLSYVAHIERDNIRQRQAEGIAAARARGVRFGRPRIERPEAFETVRGLYSSGGLTCAEAAEACGVSESTFRRWIRALEDGR